jgi:hypothetical protein
MHIPGTKQYDPYSQKYQADERIQAIDPDHFISPHSTQSACYPIVSTFYIWVLWQYTQ